MRDADGRVRETALVVEPAKASEIAPMLTAAYGLSPRDIEITGLVARGASAADIAAALTLSAHTVRDHVKAIFEKVGGTGRVALPLASRGVRVVGIDNSEAMFARLREKPGAERVDALVGDIASTRVEGEFSVVYLVFNTIFNLTTQDGQVACFENAAAHLRSGGRFVIEARVPELQRLPLGQTVLPWRADPTGLSFYVYDVVTQRLSGQHYYLEDGALGPSPTEMRYAWPAELDLMARIAGLRLEHRWADWDRAPFTALSPAHVSVYGKA